MLLISFGGDSSGGLVRTVDRESRRSKRLAYLGGQNFSVPWLFFDRRVVRNDGGTRDRLDF